MAIVPGRLFTEMGQDPTQVPPPSVTVDANREIQLGLRQRVTTAAACSPIQGAQLIGIVVHYGVELPVPVLFDDLGNWTEPLGN